MTNIRLHNIDCMEFMKGVPDKFYELAIADPPYGIGVSKRKVLGGDKNGGSVARQKNGAKLRVKNRLYRVKDWDNQRPGPEYFMELQRVSKNQIIFGGNYFADMLPASSSWIFWDKEQSGHYGDGELAWTSFEGTIRKITVRWNGMIQYDMANKEERIHQSQKPIPLYKELLSMFASDGDKILDTHGGSASIAIACYDLGFELDLCELDEDHFKDSRNRVNDHIAKYAPADQIPVNNDGQTKLF